MVFPACLLILVELVLQLLGFGYPTRFFLKLPGQPAYTANMKFAWQYHPREIATRPTPFVMAAQKAPGTIRIFILGESAAAGTPDPAFGFARILGVILRRQYPDRRFEVINAAMRGINSHAILPIARECLQHQPDLLLVYMGNNESIGLYSPEPGALNLAPYRRIIRAIQVIKKSKLAQLMESVLRATGGTHNSKLKEQDMDFFRAHRLAADDPLRNSIYDNFRANLEEICNRAGRAGVRVVVSSVAVNLRDFPPLASLHRRDLAAPEKMQWDAAYTNGIAAETAALPAKAVELYLTAARLDDHFADLHFRLARCYLAMGRRENATRHFGLARDWDALQFRADSRLNRIIRDTATGTERPGLYLLDAERVLAGDDRDIPGKDLFYEHVHFRFDGDYLLARAFLPAVVKAMALGAAQHPIPSRQECAEALAFTKWDEINTASAMVKATARPPFLDQLEHSARQRDAEQSITNQLTGFSRAQFQYALELYRNAIARNPDDWPLHFNLGSLLGEAGAYAAAVEEFQAAVKLLPTFPPARFALANALLNSGRRDDAIRRLHEVLELDPEFSPAKEALEQSAKESKPRK